MSGSREHVLSAARRSTAGGAALQPDALSGTYRRRGTLEGKALMDRFVERVEDYRAKVIRVGSADLARAVAETLEARGARRLAVPEDLPDAWGAACSPSTEWVRDRLKEDVVRASDKPKPYFIRATTFAFFESYDSFIVRLGELGVGWAGGGLGVGWGCSGGLLGWAGAVGGGVAGQAAG